MKNNKIFIFLLSKIQKYIIINQTKMVGIENNKLGESC